ncbi:MAG: H-NS family nucleoid-associated regulatory protein [Hyphomicrobiaceae bacterium]
MATSLEWEYRKIALSDLRPRTDDIDLLNEVGSLGWELVTILLNNVAYLKRAVTPPGESIVDASEKALPSSEVKPKYRDPKTGETWSGRGRMAGWLKRKVDAGENRDDYLA